MVELLSDSAREVARDAARYRWVLCASLSLAMTVFAIGSAVQSSVLQLGGHHIPIADRLLANFVAAVIIVCGTWVSPMRRMSWQQRAAVLTVICVVAIAIRVMIERAVGIHDNGEFLPFPPDTVPAAVSAIFALSYSLALAGYQDRLTVQARARTHQALVAAAALNALRAEEIRVRRQVAEGLHGTLQQQLVLLSTHLRRTAETLSADDPREAAIAADLNWVHDELDQLRERDVRELSRMLYPSGLDLGLAQASRMLLRRIPPSIEVTTKIDESVIAADDHGAEGIPLELRLLATRVLEEAVANALRHGNAARLDVQLHVDTAGVLHIVVDDDGSGSAAEAKESGLRLLRERLSERGGDLALVDGPMGGVRLAAQLPLADGEVP